MDKEDRWCNSRLLTILKEPLSLNRDFAIGKIIQFEQDLWCVSRKELNNDKMLEIKEKSRKIIQAWIASTLAELWQFDLFSPINNHFQESLVSTHAKSCTIVSAYFFT